MNVLLRMRKDMTFTKLVPLKYIIYATILSDIVKGEIEGDETCYAVGAVPVVDLMDAFDEWTHMDERRCEFTKSLYELADEGLILFGGEKGEEKVYVGEFRGRKVFPFETENTLSGDAEKVVREALTQYLASKSAVAKSRGGFLQGQYEEIVQRGIDQMSPKQFTELHSILYELYTGGEVYQIRNKVEMFQTNNILKAYDKYTTFAIIVEAVLNYDKHKKNGVPTLINVGYMKDDVFRHLTNPTAGSKDYMRELSTDDGEF